MRAWTRWTRESRAIAIIVAAWIVANVAIVAARPAMTRAAERDLGALLGSENERLAQVLVQWRQGMLDDGRWAARLAELALDGRRNAIDSLTLSQIPTARLWLVGRDGSAVTFVGHDTLAARHRWLAAQSLARDTTLVAVTQALNRDLRIGVGSPLTGKYAGWTAVLDVSAAERLQRRLPRLTVAGNDVQIGLSFPFTHGYVGSTWSGDLQPPAITWPSGSWALSDTGLVVRGGEMSDTTATFQIALPRRAAAAAAAARAIQWHEIALLVALPLIVLVLLVGRASRTARLRDAERSLAESQLLAAQAEGAAARARLSAIQARLHPHFLSNALHSASALIAADPEAAEEMLDRLGDLFRYTLESSTIETVRLADEWKFVRDYLDIEQLRMGARLRAEMHLDPGVADCEVPAFVLQPLVENAIKHGIAPRRSGGMIRVSAGEVRGELLLVVEDDGVGAAPDAVDAAKGTGLRTLRERLALEVRWHGSVETSARPSGGFVARVRLGTSSVIPSESAVIPSTARDLRVGPRGKADPSLRSR